MGKLTESAWHLGFQLTPVHERENIKRLLSSMKVLHYELTGRLAEKDCSLLLSKNRLALSDLLRKNC